MVHARGNMFKNVFQKTRFQRAGTRSSPFELVSRPSPRLPENTTGSTAHAIDAREYTAMQSLGRAAVRSPSIDRPVQSRYRRRGPCETRVRSTFIIMLC